METPRSIYLALCEEFSIFYVRKITIEWRIHFLVNIFVFMDRINGVLLQNKTLGVLSYSF